MVTKSKSKAKPVDEETTADSKSSKLYRFYHKTFSELRKLSGMSLGEFAKAVGVSKPLIYYWEDGRYPEKFPPLNLLIRISEILNVDISTISDIGQCNKSGVNYEEFGKFLKGIHIYNNLKVCGAQVAVFFGDNSREIRGMRQAEETLRSGLAESLEKYLETGKVSPHAEQKNRRKG